MVDQFSISVYFFGKRYILGNKDISQKISLTFKLLVKKI